MVLLVVDMDSYELFLGLDFLMKIGVVMDVEKGIIQVWNEHGMEMEVLPLNVVNMLHVLKTSEEENNEIQKKIVQCGDGILVECSGRSDSIINS
jgi:hypothetical protein